MALAAPIVVQGEAGISLSTVYSPITQTTSATSTPEYPGLPFLPGTRVVTTNGGEFIFVTLGTTSITQYQTVAIDNTYANVLPVGGAVAFTADPAGLANFPGFVQVSGGTSLYSLWAQISGTFTALVASASVYGPLYTLDTAGGLTGATNTTSHYQVSGVTCVVTASGSTVSATLCVGNAVSIRKPLAGS